MSIDLVDRIKTKAALSEFKRVLPKQFKNQSCLNDKEIESRSFKSRSNFSDAYLHLVALQVTYAHQQNQLSAIVEEQLEPSERPSFLHSKRVQNIYEEVQKFDKKEVSDDDFPFSDKLANYDTIKCIESGKRGSVVRSCNTILPESRWYYLIPYVGDSPWDIYLNGPYEGRNKPYKNLWYFLFEDTPLSEYDELIFSDGSMFNFAYYQGIKQLRYSSASVVIDFVWNGIQKNNKFKKALNHQDPFVIFNYCILLFRRLNIERESLPSGGGSASGSILNLLDYIFSGTVKLTLKEYGIYQEVLDYVVNLLFHNYTENIVFSDLRLSQLR